MQRIEGANATSVGLFTEGPPATTVTADWLNSIQEEIAHVIEQSGFSLLNAVNDTRTQLWESIAASIRPFDYVVNSQQTFQDAIERVGANQYKIKSAYKSILFRIRTGGYSMVAAASALSSAVDSWGYLETNATSHLEFESGAYIAMGATRGYIEVNTADCYLKNVWVKGESGTAVASLSQSFLLNNVRVTFDNCKCSERNSSSNMAGFQGSGTALHNITSKYVNCSAFTLDGSGLIYGYLNTMNLSNCLSYDLESSAASVYGMRNIELASNCYIYNLTGSLSAYGVTLSNNLSNIKVELLVATIDQAYAFHDCDVLTACYATNITANDQSSGFTTCTNMSSCYAYDIDSTTNNGAWGFNGCLQVSGCEAEKIDYSGGAALNATGFINCGQISACNASDIDVAGGGSAQGFSGCNYGSSLFTSEAVNGSNDWIDTVDAQITNKVSTPSVWT